MSELLMSASELSSYLGVPLTTIDSLSRKRQKPGAITLPFLKIGKRRFFRKATVDAWLAARETSR